MTIGTISVFRPSRWVKPFLFFVPVRIHVSEPDEKGYVIVNHFKKLWGKTYVVKSTRYIPPPEHFNCRCAKVDL